MRAAVLPGRKIVRAGASKVLRCSACVCVWRAGRRLLGRKQSAPKGWTMSLLNCFGSEDRKSQNLTSTMRFLYIWFLHKTHSQLPIRTSYRPACISCTLSTAKASESTH